MKSMYVCEAWMRLRVYMSVQAMYGAGNALYWNDSERQNSMHLTLLKYLNTKTSLYKLSKSHWVIALFKNFGSVRKKSQYTVSFDHPVCYEYFSAGSNGRLAGCFESRPGKTQPFDQVSLDQSSIIKTFYIRNFLD